MYSNKIQKRIKLYFVMFKNSHFFKSFTLKRKEAFFVSKTKILNYQFYLLNIIKKIYFNFYKWLLKSKSTEDCKRLYL